jgi:hypothetical protein
VIIGGGCFSNTVDKPEVIYQYPSPEVKRYLILWSSFLASLPWAKSHFVPRSCDSHVCSLNFRDIGSLCFPSGIPQEQTNEGGWGGKWTSAAATPVTAASTSEKRDPSMTLLRWNMLNQSNSFVYSLVSLENKVVYVVCVYDSELKVFLIFCLHKNDCGVFTSYVFTIPS